jgi:hypothetical protein
VAHRYIFSYVSDFILADWDTTGCGFVREIAHRHIFYDVIDFIFPDPNPPDSGLGSARAFLSNRCRLQLRRGFRRHGRRGQ